MRTSSHLLALLICLTVPCHAAQKMPKESGPATSYGDADSHPAEHVAIAAEPFNGSKAGFFHINYPAYGIMPIRLIITNDGDKPVSLSEARIDFITAAGDKIPAAQIEDMQRMIDTPPNPASRIPLGPIHVGGKGKNRDKEIQEDLDAYAFHSTTIEPHSTRSGFLFYDVSGVDHPLVGARIEARRLQTAEGKEMFAFEIPFYKLGPSY